MPWRRHSGIENVSHEPLGPEELTEIKRNDLDYNKLKAAWFPTIDGLTTL
jgi:hypothetical protein